MALSLFAVPTDSWGGPGASHHLHKIDADSSGRAAAYVARKLALLRGEEVNVEAPRGQHSHGADGRAAAVPDRTNVSTSNGAECSGGGGGANRRDPAWGRLVVRKALVDRVVTKNLGEMPLPCTFFLRWRHLFA